ncbi:MAG TPA: D-alanyl-D-alanine carboxypeptidase/D-alanyl-D-alanine-endopeptidase [Methylophilaceae bacterium]|jgi:D-alanyl-D-alanine carboxypeptidase/D-alanyl-D-alanine-endopeptidase (penicillin-binding protein 4)
MKISQFSLQIATFLCFFTVLSAHAELPDSVIAALKKEGIPADAVSVYVQPLADSPNNLAAPLISHQAQKALNPASTMKLVTSDAALEILGPAYRWKTEVYYDGSLRNGTLDGNLYLKGYGDPHLMSSDMWRLVTQIKQAGIKQIKGDLILDDSFFASQSTNPSNFDGDGARAYNATPSAMMSNLKMVSFRFASDDAQLNITPDPDLTEIHINNQLKVNGGDCSSWRSRLNYEVNASKTPAEVIFSGAFPANCTEKYLELLVLSPADLSFNLFRKLLREQAGNISGKVKTTSVPVGAIKLLQFDSATLADLLSDVNKWSNNLMARQLLLTIAAESQGAPATEEKGVTAIKAWLASKNLAFSELVIENGSGLSRSERISAQHMGALLTSAFYSPVMPEFMASLPILAVDGTLLKRMKDSPAQGRAHLKTGTIDGVFAISGYILGKNGKRYVMVFMINHAKAAQTKPAQDALIDWVFQQN